jgi:outer membrane protein
VTIRSILMFSALPALLLTGPVAAQGQPTQEPAPVSTSGALTLTEALQRGLAANLGVMQSRVEVSASQAATRTILGSILPKINLVGATTQNSEEVTFGSGTDQRILLPGTDWSFRLTFSQPIYAGAREHKALQQSRLTTENARFGVLGAEDQVLLAVAADYLSVVEGEELLAVEQRNLELARKRREQAQIFFEAGETTRVDALRAEADIKGAERRLALARQQRESAASRLRLDLAVDDPSAPLRVTTPAAPFPAAPAESALVSEAMARRPEILQAQTNLEIARLEVLKQRGALLPVVTANGGWLKQRSTFPSDNYGFVTLNFNVPLYQGGEIKARTEVARERQRQAELQVEQLKQQVREQVHQALLDLETAEANLRLSQEQLSASEAEYEQSSELYRAQELTSLEAQSSEVSLAESRRAVASAKLDRDLAELRVWATAGLLKKTLLPEGNP